MRPTRLISLSAPAENITIRKANDITFAAGKYFTETNARYFEIRNLVNIVLP